MFSIRSSLHSILFFAPLPSIHHLWLSLDSIVQIIVLRSLKRRIRLLIDSSQHYHARTSRLVLSTIRSTPRASAGIVEIEIHDVYKLSIRARDELDLHQVFMSDPGEDFGAESPVEGFVEREEASPPVDPFIADESDAGAHVMEGEDEEDEFGDFGEAEVQEEEYEDIDVIHGPRRDRGLEEIMHMTTEERNKFLDEYFREFTDVEDSDANGKNFHETANVISLVDSMDRKWKERFENPQLLVCKTRYRWEGSALQRKIASAAKAVPEVGTEQNYESDIATPAPKFARSTSDSQPKDENVTNYGLNAESNGFDGDEIIEAQTLDVEERAMGKAEIETDGESPNETCFKGAQQSDYGREERATAGPPQGAEEYDLSLLEALGSVGSLPFEAQRKGVEATSNKNVFSELRGINARRGKSWFGPAAEEAVVADPFAASELVPVEIISRKRGKNKASDGSCATDDELKSILDEVPDLTFMLAVEFHPPPL